MNLDVEITMRVESFCGWPKAVKLSNSLVEVIVVPEIGRIMHFSRIRQPNWLLVNKKYCGLVLSEGKPRYENEQPVHTPFGGDRIWPMQENDFIRATGSFRPADYYIDGLPWESELLPAGVKIISPISQFTGVQIERTITMQPAESKISIQQKMVKHHACEPKDLAPLPLTIWNISVVDSPEQIILPIANANVFQDNDGVLVHKWPVDINHAKENLKRFGRFAILTVNPDCPHQKLGANADGWIAAIRNHQAFVETFAYDETATYPDGGTSATTFTAGTLGELECLSPLVGLECGDEISFDLTWDLLDLPSESNSENRANLIDDHVRGLPTLF